MDMKVMIWVLFILIIVLTHLFIKTNTSFKEKIDDLRKELLRLEQKIVTGNKDI